MGSSEIRLVIVDDHSIFRDGVRRTLSLEEDFKVIGVNPFSTEEFRLYFYRTGSSPVPTEALIPLVSALESEMSQIRGASFSEE